MDLQELAERTRIPVRRLRHCLDEGLVPGLKIQIAENEVGRPRRFHEDVGFAICCAAKLIEAGVDRSTVRAFMNGMSEVTFPNSQKLVIVAFIERQAKGLAHLGDSCNMRFELEVSGLPHEVKWVNPGNPAPLVPEYRPMTIISLDIGQVGTQVFGWSKDR